MLPRDHLRRHQTILVGHQRTQVRKECVSCTLVLDNDAEILQAQGCALRIRLSSRNRKVYSVNTIYNSLSEARNACAEVALAEGVLDYIKAWSPVAYDLKEEPESTTSLSLQQFFDLLPKPFPEPVVGTAADMNGPAWLNTTIQAARGAKLVPNFIWIVDPRFGCESSHFHSRYPL